MPLTAVYSVCVSKISRTKLKSEERKKERNEKQRQKSRLKFSVKTRLVEFVTISVKRFSSQTRNLVFQGSWLAAMLVYKNE